MRLSPFFILGLLVMPAAAFAAATIDAGSNAFVPLLPSLPGIQSLQSSDQLAPFLSQVYKICIGLAAVLAVLQIMRAGVIYMGVDSFTEKKQAKDLIGMSLAGLLLVLSPVIVFTIINPSILKLDLNVKGLETESAPVNIDSGSSVTAPSGAQCKDYTDMTVLPDANGCDAGSGFEILPGTCCSITSSGGTCCARKIGSTPAKASPAAAATTPAPRTANRFVYRFDAGGYPWVIGVHTKANPSCLTYYASITTSAATCSSSLSSYKATLTSKNIDMAQGIVTTYDCKPVQLVVLDQKGLCSDQKPLFGQ